MTPCRIWDVAPHLCGFPADVARRRLLLPLKAFIDDSGKNDPPVYILAGFIARAEQWGDFNDAWRAALDEPPGLEYFKIKDAFSGEGAFAHWPRDRGLRIARVKSLASIIESHVLTAISASVRHDDYNEVYKGSVSKVLDSPYYMMFYSILIQAFDWMRANNIDDTIDFIFDEQMHDSDNVMAVWTRFFDSLPPELQKLVGSRPSHESDLKMLPLQAADLLAGSLRRIGWYAHEGKPVDDFVTRSFRAVPMSHFIWTKDQLSKIYEKARNAAQEEGAVFHYQFQAMAENIGRVTTLFNLRQVQSAEPGELIQLASIRAKEMKRFVLVHSCPRVGTSHLHRRDGGACFEGSEGLLRPPGLPLPKTE